MLRLSTWASRTATSHFSFPQRFWRERRITLRVLLQKSLGLPRRKCSAYGMKIKRSKMANIYTTVVTRTLKSQLLFVQLRKQSCTHTTPNGSVHTEICLSDSTNGTLSSDGSSRTHSHSSAPESSCGRRVIPPTCTERMLRRKSWRSSTTTLASTLNSLLSQPSRVRRLRRKSLLEVSS